MKLYNTLSRKVEEFKPINPPEVGMYICGPTVYDYSHIGHSRTYINSDVLIRVLRWLGFKVKPVMNITDVGHLTSNADEGEDKMEKKARTESKSILGIAKFYTDDFWQMEQELNIIRPDIVTPATQYIEEMIKLIKKLEQKGFTYQTKDGVYFDTSKLKDYGKLARLDIAGLREGWRVEKREKKNPTDFAIWKFSPSPSVDGSGQARRQSEWPSPWGMGFPGWHIECSAMSMKHLGESLDIHTGGVDHIPVHHTNEIAQSEAATGKQFVKYWFHSGFLMVEGEKMSKSLGNFIRLQDLIDQGYEPMSLRYLFLTSHYRTTVNFTFAALKASQEAYRKLKAIVAGWQGDKSRTNKVRNLVFKFREAAENDLNLPQALAVVWEMAKSNIPSRDKLELITDWDQVLGLDLLTPVQLIKVPEEVKKLIKNREALRKKEMWVEADAMRKEIEKKGFKVSDTKLDTVRL